MKDRVRVKAIQVCSWPGGHSRDLPANYLKSLYGHLFSHQHCPGYLSHYVDLHTY